MGEKNTRIRICDQQPNQANKEEKQRIYVLKEKEGMKKWANDDKKTTANSNNKQQQQTQEQEEEG